MELPKEISGVVVGELDDIELEQWNVLAPDASTEEARSALDLDPGQAAAVILREGRIAFREQGRIPLYKWGLAADLIGVEFQDHKPKRGI